VGSCQLCGARGPLISDAVGVCLTCLRNRPEEALPLARERRQRLLKRRQRVPRTPGGLVCTGCSNRCRLGPGEEGFCSLVRNENGRLVRVVPPNIGVLEWYFDPIPTNCVCAHFAACTGVGYPRYAHTPGVEAGYYNLAVFFGGCNFHCLYCQNYHHQDLAFRRRPSFSIEEMLRIVEQEPRASCICYFGGDPTPQLSYALELSHRILESFPNRVFRICWETNGGMNRNDALACAELSWKSGGTMKFDLKCFDPVVGEVLCGTSTLPQRLNFEVVAQQYAELPSDHPPVVAASTLLVPGYVDDQEVAKLAELIASINPRIPYVLLAFYPTYVMTDLPTTPRRLAEACLRAARKAGLENVYLGNIHLLS